MTAAPARIHTDRATDLTLSEAPSGTRSGSDPSRLPGDRHEPRNITLRGGRAAALATAIGDHLSTRVGRVDVTSSHAPALRAAYVLDALEKAARCPLCAPDLEALGLVKAAGRG